MSWRRPPSGRSCLSPLGGGLVSGSARGKTRAAGTIPWGIRRAPGRTSRRHGRVPGAWAPLAPHRKGPQHILVRQRLQEDVPPPWPWQVRVVAEAGCAANAPRRRRTPHKETEGCALPQPQTPSPPRWALLHPLPQSRATVPPRGDGTSGRATQRRHEGPKNVQILVPYLLEAPIGAMRKLDAWRGGPIQARQSGVPLGQRHVTNARARGGAAHEAVRHTAQEWQRKVQQGKDVASCRHDNLSLLSTFLRMIPGVGYEADSLQSLNNHPRWDDDTPAEGLERRNL